jgi:hypothetical protein
MVCTRCIMCAHDEEREISVCGKQPPDHAPQTKTTQNIGLWAGAPLGAFAPSAELLDGRKLSAGALQEAVCASTSLDFHCTAGGGGRTASAAAAAAAAGEEGDDAAASAAAAAAAAAERWLLSRASLVQHPATGEPCIVLVQVDATDAKQVRA